MPALSCPSQGPSAKMPVLSYKSSSLSPSGARWNSQWKPASTAGMPCASNMDASAYMAMLPSTPHIRHLVNIALRQCSIISCRLLPRTALCASSNMHCRASLNCIAFPRTFAQAQKTILYSICKQASSETAGSCSTRRQLQRRPLHSHDNHTTRK